MMEEQEHESENKILKCRVEELEKQQKDLVDKLKDKIECPVCMEIPRKGPVPVCPNGHFVCQTCKKESCPTCRSNMGSNKSILAGTIIDNIEHQCKFEDCDKTFLLPDLEKHEEACPHRRVVCPHPSCAALKVPISKLRSHLLNKSSCHKDNVLVHLHKNKRCTTFDMANVDVTDLLMVWGLDTFSFDEMDFVVFPHKSKGQFFFVIVMLGTEVQCSEYTVMLEVHEYSEFSDTKNIFFKFYGSPTSIDVDETERDSFILSERSMNRVMNKSSDKTNSFSVTYSIAKKKQSEITDTSIL